MVLFLKAMGLGLAVAAPVGPMSVLCMRRSLGHGWRAGLATGAGIASGDAVYALVAGLGLAGVSGFMVVHVRLLHLAAGLVFLFLGLRTLCTRKAETDPVAPNTSIGAAYAGSVVLTLTNPATIIMFAAVLAALAPQNGFAPHTLIFTVCGVLMGSAVWWCGLVVAVTAARHALGLHTRHWIDRIAGVVLAGFGVAEIYRTI